MGFNLTHLQYFTLFLVVFTLNISTVCEAQSATNVTVDYQDSSIIYSPPGAWTLSVQSDLDYGGFHMLTETPGATASLNFTGVAIYFISPLWPYIVNTAVSVDSGPITLIDLQDHNSTTTNGGPETVAASVVWGATGLANTEHKLLISVGTFGIVDGLIFTTVPNVSSSTSSSQLPTSTSSSIVASSTASATPSPISHPKSRLAIPLGSVFGVLGLLIILGGVWCLFRRRKRKPNSEIWTLDGSATSMLRNPSVVGPNISDRNGTWTSEQPYDDGYPMNQPNDGNSWHTPHHEYVGIPVPPIPSEPHYHTGYQNAISSRTAMHQMTARMPNRYEPGGALSTISEGSTPQMGEGRTTLGNSPPPYQTDLVYYKSHGSEGYFQQQE